MRAFACLASLLLVVGPGCDDFASFSGGAGEDVDDLAAPRDLAVLDAAVDATVAPDLAPRPLVTEQSGTQEELNGVWGSGPDDVWAVGMNGTVLHRRAGTWTRELANVGESLFAVWGGGPRDVWMAGDQGRVVHFDGSFRSTMTAEKSPLYGGSLAGSGNSTGSNIMVGSAGLVYTYSGGAWQRSLFRAIQPLFSVWSQSDTTQWTVGTGGVIVQLIAGAGVVELSGTAVDLRGVWGDGKGTVVAVGGGGTVLRRTMAGWVMGKNADTRDLRAVTGCGGRLFAVGADGAMLRSLDGGKSWEPVPGNIGPRLSAVWCSSVDDVFAVGNRGLIVHAGG